MEHKTISLIKIKSLFLIAFLLFSFNTKNVFSAGSPLQTPCTSWDLTAAIGSWTTFENPHPDSCSNPDVWQFMISTGLTQDPQTYSIASYFTSSYYNTPGVYAWTKTEGALWPMIRYNATDTTLWGVSLPHTVEIHPENNQLAIIAWKSPVSGYVSITGGVVDAHAAGGDGIQWFIDKNSSNLAYGSYGDGGSQDFANGTNGSNLSSIAVNTNDMLYLIVHPNGNDAADTTRVNLTINATNQSTNTPSPYTSWDLNSAVGSWTTFENPHPDSWGNPDVWQFMISTGLTQDPATYSIASYFTSSYYNQPNVYAWTKTEGALWPVIRYNATDTTLWGISLPHIVEVHPENNQLAIIAWKSPVSGYVSITGSIVDAHTAGGDGIKWFIDKNSSNLAYGSYGDGGSQDFANGTNGSNLSSIAVNTNDMLYLIVHPNGNDSADTTRVNLVINAINIFTSTPTATFTPTSTPTLTPTFTPTLTPTPTNSYVYNRSAAVDYANAWVNSRNPSFPMSSNAGCGCDNCTNYASQVLYTGSYPTRVAPGGGYLDYSELWWYNPANLTPSGTWYSAELFKNYLDIYANYGEFEQKIWPEGEDGLSGGDIIVLDLYNNESPDGTGNPDWRPDHVRVVVGRGYTSTNPNDYADPCTTATPTVPVQLDTLLINQQCVDRWHVKWNYNVTLDYHHAWYFHVIE